jgi:hypothetical protein
MTRIGRVIAHRKLAIRIIAISAATKTLSIMSVVMTQLIVSGLPFRLKTSLTYKYSNTSSRSPTAAVIGVTFGVFV